MTDLILSEARWQLCVLARGARIWLLANIYSHTRSLSSRKNWRRQQQRPATASSGHFSLARPAQWSTLNRNETICQASGLASATNELGNFFVCFPATQSCCLTGLCPLTSQRDEDTALPRIPVLFRGISRAAYHLVCLACSAAKAAPRGTVKVR